MPPAAGHRSPAGEGKVVTGEVQERIRDEEWVRAVWGQEGDYLHNNSTHQDLISQFWPGTS